MTNARDLRGSKFGKWFVIGREPNAEDGSSMWMCVCECGAKGIVRGRSLTSNNSKQCKNCAAREVKLLGKGSNFRPQH